LWESLFCPEEFLGDGTVNKLIFMLKKIIFSSLFLFLIFSAFGIAAQAQTNGDAINGLDQTAGKVTAFQGQISTVDNSFIQTQTGRIIGVVLSFVGVIFLIMMIYAGIMWMTAQGNDQQVTKAKELLVNSIIGIIIIFAAYAITAFIGNFVSNLTTTQ
jgi:TRAP-type C4-dicarboxylate transport system permease small subunit